MNNIQYVRYAESGRCNWMRNFGTHFDPMNKKKWTDLLSSRGVGLILRSIKVDYKFVSRCDHSQSHLTALPCHTADDEII